MRTLLLVLATAALAGCSDTMDTAWKSSSATSGTRVVKPVVPVASATPASPTVTASSAPAAASSPAAAGAVTFSQDVAPLIESRCASCHGPGGSGADDALLTTAAGKADYAAIKGDISQIVSVVQRGKMPEGGPRFTSAEVAVLQRWQQAGSPQN